MAYVVTKSASSKTGWRVLWRTHLKNEETGKYDKVKYRHIPASEYGRIGITTEMQIEEVKAVIKKLSAEDELKRREDQRNKVELRLAEDRKIECAHLPPVYVEKFEREHLGTRYLGNDHRLRKIMSNWHAAQIMMRTVTLPMEKWHRYPEHFYNYCLKKVYSPGYVENLLFVVNLYLDYLGFEQDKPYRPVPPANSVWKGRLALAYEDAGKGKASLPMTPEQLEEMRAGFDLAQHNWLYCTVWAGLRPNEADALLDKKRTKVTYQKGVPILNVYQSKLKNVPKPEDRWKYIPLVLPEQRLILEIIKSGELRTPLPKTIQARLGEGYGLYAGRKGFHDLMVSRYGQPELEVIRWLGHRSLDMAMKHYAKKDAVRWKEPEEVA